LLNEGKEFSDFASIKNILDKKYNSDSYAVYVYHPEE
jgi:hypothetical protein